MSLLTGTTDGSNTPAPGALTQQQAQEKLRELHGSKDFFAWINDPKERGKRATEYAELVRVADGLPSAQPPAEIELQAREEIIRMKMDDDFMAKMFDPYARGHKEAVDTWAGVHRIAFPGQVQPEGSLETWAASHVERKDTFIPPESWGGTKPSA